MEVDAISRIVALQKQFPSLRCHIVHLSAAAALPIVRSAKAAGAKLTVETCFHYLCLEASAIPAGRPEFKCCPPIRDEANRAALWDALADGTIDCVVSDHSPCVAELKKLDDGDIMSAWGGISTLGLGLSLLWTEASQRGFGVRKVLEWTSGRTAAHGGVSDRKGKLAVGYDADIVLWDPKAEFTVSSMYSAFINSASDFDVKVTKESLNFKNKLTPYEGKTLRGRVERTILRGQTVFSRDNGFDGFTPIGTLL